MNIKDMICFICVYDEGSFTKASSTLYVTPQGISKTIRRMEQELGADLFIRNTSGGLHPTKADEYFYQHIRNLVDEYRKIEEGVYNISSQDKGILRLVSAFGILRFLTPEFINRFKDINPDIHLEYMEYPDIYILQNILDGNYDLGMMPYINIDPAVNIIPMFSRELYLIVNRESIFYNEPEISIKDLSKEPLIIENQNFLIHKIIKDACDKYETTCRVYFETSGFSLCYKLCNQGKANTVSMDFIFDDMGNENLRMIPFSEHLFWNTGLVLRKDIPVSSISGKFIDFTKDWCKSHLPKTSNN